MLWRTSVVLGWKPKLFLLMGCVIVLSELACPAFTKQWSMIKLILRSRRLYSDYSSYEIHRLCYVRLHDWHQSLLDRHHGLQDMVSSQASRSCYSGSYVAHHSFVRHHRRTLKRNHLHTINTTTVQMVLVLLVESGALYCVLWVTSHFYPFRCHSETERYGTRSSPWPSRSLV